MVRVSTIALEDLSSIPSRVIPKIKEMVLDAFLLNTQVRVNWSNPGKGVAPFPTLLCSSYRRESRTLLFTYKHRHSIHVCVGCFIAYQLLWVIQYQIQFYI